MSAARTSWHLRRRACKLVPLLVARAGRLARAEQRAICCARAPSAAERAGLVAQALARRGGLAAVELVRGPDGARAQGARLLLVLRARRADQRRAGGGMGRGTAGL